MRKHTGTLAARFALIVGLAAPGCSDTTMAPSVDGPAALSVLPGSTAFDTRARLRDMTATAEWNAVALEIIPRLRVGPVPVTRTLAYLTTAQSRAVRSAHSTGEAKRSRLEGAVAGASVVVLSYLFPGEALRLEALLTAQTADAGLETEAFAEGVAGGRDVGAAVVATARTDNFDAIWTGTVPSGTGIWYSSLVPPQPPATPMLGEMRPFHLETADQFRPDAPPTFGSPEFVSALAEVRRISDTRTAEQAAIARKWALSTGTISPTGYFNQVAIALAQEAGFGERSTAEALATVNTAMMDAYIACWDAKFVYWLLRPIQADPAITLAIPMANHPAYPSGHSCISSAAAAVLSATFPENRRELHATALEIGLSRIYAGVHYRFDIEAGDAIGLAVAKLALQSQRD